jgi:sec-independent protein translocase protein TatC
MTQAAAKGGKRMTISEHLEELRSRLVRSLLAIGVGFVVAFWRIEDVVRFLRAPLDAVIARFEGDVMLIQGKVYGGFLGSMKVALFAGAVLAAPVVLYQLWAFVGAGLYRHERRAVKFYATPGFVLFFLGAYLAYAYVMPFALEFLISWSREKLGLQSLLEFSDYVSLIAFAMFVFGLIFQLPVVMVFLMRVGVVEPAFFRKYRRHAILANFILAMVLTPPDVVSQIALALCMTLLYEGAIVVGSLLARGRTQEG